ncbi:hypothetical protein ANO11243_042040 [Dothideomycetidae sp. 11243]|nr:hypothetical protein ANO11243_042040 [fungal sp. No.11243]
MAKMNTTMQTLNPTRMPKNITLWLTIIFSTTFASSSDIIFTQYVSNLLRWSISTVGYLASVKAFVTLGMLVLLASFTYVSRRADEAQSPRMDTLVARVSLVSLALGDAILALGRTPGAVVGGSIISSTGYGVGQTLRGILASCSSAYGIPTGRLFAGAALVELLASFVGSMAFAWLFGRGLDLPTSRGIGLPYYISSVRAA